MKTQDNQFDSQFNGCIWHKHDCLTFVWPSSNRGYWILAIERNVIGDNRNHKLLNDLGRNVSMACRRPFKSNSFELTMNQLTSKIAKGMENHE